MTQTVEQAPVEIQPGEAVDIRFGRLSDGQWFASIGAGDESAPSATAAWPWEALRGLAKQVKDSDLSPFRLAGEQEIGRCVHASPDGRMCCVLECPTGGAEAVIRSLRLVSDQLGDDFPQLMGSEIVRLCGTLKEPVLRGKGEDEDQLTATFEVMGDDLTPEYRYLRPSAKKQVVAIVYHAYAAPKYESSDPDQMALPIEDSGEINAEGGDESIQDLYCPACNSGASSEYVSEGRVCLGCGNANYQRRELQAEPEQATETAPETSEEPA